MNLSDHDTGEDDVSDMYLHTEEKKRKLTLEQVTALEESFEVGNKLEVDRKLQLAKALGLQPKQIAVWFQNRRARCKIKQVERQFDALKQEYDYLKGKYEILLAQNRKFKAEVDRLSSEPENNDQTSKVKGSKIESRHKSTNSVPEPTKTPIELSVKFEIYQNCTEPMLDISPTITKEQEGRCYSIMSEPASSGCNIDSLRTIQCPHSPRYPQTARSGNNSSLPPLEGSSVAGAQKSTSPVHDKQCPKVEVDGAWFNQAEETCCTLFQSLEEQGAVMLWEYWHLTDE